MKNIRGYPGGVRKYPRISRGGALYINISGYRYKNIHGYPGGLEKICGYPGGSMTQKRDVLNRGIRIFSGKAHLIK